VRRDGKVTSWSLRMGVPQDGLLEQRDGFEVRPLKITGDTEARGTEVHFLPDETIFENIDFHYDVLAKRLRELSFLNNGVKIRLVDERNNKEDNFAFAGGVKGFVEFINTGKKVLHPNVFHAAGDKLTDNGTNDRREVAMQWNDGYSENVLCFTNNIPQRDGGTHLTGLRAAMTRNHQQVHRRQRAGQEGQGRDCRRRHARRPGLRAQREGARAQVQQPDQGQAGVQRSARPGGRRS
jgi:DNA gyrase subunit B